MQLWHLTVFVFIVFQKFKMNIKIITLGCKVNQYDGQVIAESFNSKGISSVEDEKKADIFVVNSCTVTAESDRKARQLVRRLKRSYKNSVIVLTGCMPQANPKIKEELPEADIVIGNKDISAVSKAVESFISNRKYDFNIENYNPNDAYMEPSIKDFSGKTRAVLKIEDGCNSFCTYCIIPRARGFVRSKSLNEIYQEAKSFEANGYKEIVLVGINLTCFGLNEKFDLSDAVNIISELDGIERIRLGSMEPEYLTDNLIQKLSENKKLCPQFHLSVQSGSDKILKKMNRKYTQSEYVDICKKLRTYFKDCSITTDIMTGFPGETEEDFLDTVKLIQTVNFEKAHIFPYSERPQTPAICFKNSVPMEIRRKRAIKLIKITEEIRKQYFFSQINSVVQVLCEKKKKNGLFFGYTKNYIPVYFKSDKNVTENDFINVLLNNSDENGCYGNTVEDKND